MKIHHFTTRRNNPKVIYVFSYKELGFTQHMHMYERNEIMEASEQLIGAWHVKQKNLKK